jgi:hypothetical protein
VNLDRRFKGRFSAGGATCANTPVVTNKPNAIGANILDVEKPVIPTPAEPR